MWLGSSDRDVGSQHRITATDLLSFDEKPDTGETGGPVNGFATAQRAWKLRQRAVKRRQRFTPRTVSCICCSPFNGKPQLSLQNGRWRKPCVSHRVEASPGEEAAAGGKHTGRGVWELSRLNLYWQAEMQNCTVTARKTATSFAGRSIRSKSRQDNGNGKAGG